MYLMLTLCKGAVSALDSEHVCSISQPSSSATDSSSGEGQLLLCHVLQLILQFSPLMGMKLNTNRCLCLLCFSVERFCL